MIPDACYTLDTILVILWGAVTLRVCSRCEQVGIKLTVMLLERSTHVREGEMEGGMSGSHTFHSLLRSLELGSKGGAL